jgi:Spy/CpxP family protein refolding chaperone
MPFEKWSRVALAALVVLGCAQQGPAPAGDAPAREDESAEVAGDAGAERPDPSRFIWWNNEPTRELLELSADQRAKMDGALSEFLEKHRTIQESRRAVRTELTAAFRDGAWPQAKEKSKALSALTAEWDALHAEMVIRVLGEMTPEQRQKLAAERPNLLDRPWVSSLGRGGAGRRRANR